MLPVHKDRKDATARAKGVEGSDASMLPVHKDRKDVTAVLPLSFHWTTPQCCRSIRTGKTRTLLPTFLVILEPQCCRSIRTGKTRRRAQVNAVYHLPQCCRSIRTGKTCPRCRRILGVLRASMLPVHKDRKDRRRGHRPRRAPHRLNAAGP